MQVKGLFPPLTPAQEPERRVGVAQEFHRLTGEAQEAPGRLLGDHKELARADMVEAAGRVRGAQEARGDAIVERDFIPVFIFTSYFCFGPFV